MRRETATKFFKNYDRVVGLIAILIPAGILASFGLVTGGLIHIAVWILGMFTPLAIFSYYLDVISDIFSFEWLDEKVPFLKIILLWIVFYPIFSVFAILIRSILLGLPFMYTLVGLVGLALLGAIFGFYFYIAYMYVNKVKRWVLGRVQRTRRKE